MRASTVTAARQAARTAPESATAAGEARRGRMQAAALGDDDGHHEAPHRRADGERMAEALDALVAADDQARAERARASSCAATRACRSRSRSPGRHASSVCLECARRRRLPSSARSLALGGLECEAQAGERILGVDAEGPVAIARERRGRGARELARRSHEARPRPRTTRRRSRRGHARRDRAPPRCEDARRWSSARARRRRDHEPHRTRRRPRLDAIREPGREPGDGARRRQDGRRRAEIGDQRRVPARASRRPLRRQSFRLFRTAETMIANAFMLLRRCQPPLRSAQPNSIC